MTPSKRPEFKVEGDKVQVCHLIAMPLGQSPLCPGLHYL